MALTSAEIVRCKAELGVNLLTVGAEPYISVLALFDQVIKSNVLTGASTTATGAIAASGVPALSTLTIASGAGFAAGDRVFIDVDSQRENVSIASITGTTVTAWLSKAHAGTYLFALESGETLVREALARIAATKARLASIFGSGSLKKVDEIEFYDTRRTQFGQLGIELLYWRDELASLLGCPNFWRNKMSAGSTIAMY